MTILSLVFKPQPILRQISAPIEDINDEIRQLAEDMLETMRASKGVGLAAVQVGIPKRIVVIQIPKPEEEVAPLILINPEIIAKSEHRTLFKEGCLSIPGIMAEIDRPSEVTIEFMNLEGQRLLLNASGILATCIQHEIDHLNGILFTDYLETY